MKTSYIYSVGHGTKSGHVLSIALAFSEVEDWHKQSNVAVFIKNCY